MAMPQYAFQLLDHLRQPQVAKFPVIMRIVKFAKQVLYCSHRHFYAIDESTTGKQVKNNPNLCRLKTCNHSYMGWDYEPEVWPVRWEDIGRSILNSEIDSIVRIVFVDKRRSVTVCNVPLLMMVRAVQ